MMMTTPAVVRLGLVLILLGTASLGVLGIRRTTKRNLQQRNPPKQQQIAYEDPQQIAYADPLPLQKETGEGSFNKGDGGVSRINFASRFALPNRAGADRKPSGGACRAAGNRERESASIRANSRRKRV